MATTFTFEGIGGGFFEENKKLIGIIVAAALIALGIWWAYSFINDIRRERDLAILEKSQAVADLKVATAEIGNLKQQMSSLKTEVDNMKSAEQARLKAQIELAGLQKMGVVNTASSRYVLARFVSKKYEDKGEKATAKTARIESKMWAVKLGLLDPKTGKEKVFIKKMINRMFLVPLKSDETGAVAVYLSTVDGQPFQEPYSVIKPAKNFEEKEAMFFQRIKEDSWSKTCPQGLSDPLFGSKDVCTDLTPYVGS